MDHLIKCLPGKHWVLSVIPSSNIKAGYSSAWGLGWQTQQDPGAFLYSETG